MIGKERNTTIRSLVILLTEIKLKAKFGRHNTDDRVIEEVGSTIPDPTLLQVDPSVTGEGALCDRKLEKIFGLPVM